MFPYEIIPVEDSLNKQLMNDFQGEKYGFVQVGPKKWFLPAIYKERAEKFYSFPLKSDDVWLITFPRSGTTVCQELIWLINNNFDYDVSSKVAMDIRFPFYEYSILHTERLHEEIIKINNNDPLEKKKLAYWRKPVYEYDLISPRHFKTHLPYSLLPPDLTKKCKSIYVARNPKDVAVSYYHHNRLLKVHDYQGDFKAYWQYFQNDLVVDAPYWEHVKEGWERRKEENVLFIFYEDLMTNMENTIKNVATFLGKPIKEDEVTKLINHLKIENFRKAVPLKEIDVKGTKNDGEQDFVRKGQICGNNEFDEQINKSADEWIKKHLKQTGITFPVAI